MNHPRIELNKYWKQKDLDAEKRIKKQVLTKVTDEEEITAVWYTFLEDRLSFPFYAYIKSPKSKGNTTHFSRIKLTRMATIDRCNPRAIWLVGYPTIMDNDAFYFCLADFKSVEVEISVFQAIQDYFYWLKKLTPIT